MLKMMKIHGMFKHMLDKSDYFSWSLFFYVSLPMLPLLFFSQSVLAQGPSPIDYYTESSLDSTVICKRPKDRDPACNNDFQDCTNFKLMYDLYTSVYALGGLKDAIAGTSDASRAQELQNRAQELIQQAKQGGIDINLEAFSALDKHAKGQIDWLISKQAMHVALGGRLAFIWMNWDNLDKAYDSSTCKIETSAGVS